MLKEYPEMHEQFERYDRATAQAVAIRSPRYPLDGNRLGATDREFRSIVTPSSDKDHGRSR